MKIYGTKTDSVQPLRRLQDEYRRFHPEAGLIVGPCWIGVEKIDHQVVSACDAGTNDGIRDGASNGFEKYSYIVTVYYDDDGLIEAQLSKPEPFPIKEVKNCKTNGCPKGFHICTKGVSA
jgi:hypothetical protein